MFDTYRFLTSRHRQHSEDIENAHVLAWRQFCEKNHISEGAQEMLHAMLKRGFDFGKIASSPYLNRVIEEELLPSLPVFQRKIGGTKYLFAHHPLLDVIGDIAKSEHLAYFDYEAPLDGRITHPRESQSMVFIVSLNIFLTCRLVGINSLIFSSN